MDKLTHRFPACYADLSTCYAAEVERLNTTAHARRLAPADKWISHRNLKQINQITYPTTAFPGFGQVTRSVSSLALSSSGESSSFGASGASCTN